ncbi:glycine-rich domain-containing protein [Deinococcus sp. UYEF24]
MTTTQTSSASSPIAAPTSEHQRRRDALSALPLPAGLGPRLRAEQGWSLAFTTAVITEYRRFLILATTTGMNVTPSRTVDHAWHAHLEYTRAYWDTLCGEILGEPLHHTPGEIGDEAHYRQQYLNTLDLYQATFGETAPLSCWPDPRRTSESNVLALTLPDNALPAGRQAGQTSPAALVMTLIGGLLSCGAVLMALGYVGVAMTGDQPGKPRRRSSSSGAGGDPAMIALVGVDSGDGGGHGDGDCGSDGGASCGSSCGGGCGGGCS